MYIDAKINIGYVEECNQIYTINQVLIGLHNSDFYAALIFPVENQDKSIIETNQLLIDSYASIIDYYKKRLFPIIKLAINSDVFNQIESNANLIQGITCPVKTDSYTFQLATYLKLNKYDHIVHLDMTDYDKNNFIKILKLIKSYPSRRYIFSNLGKNKNQQIKEAVRLIKELKSNKIYVDTVGIFNPCFINEFPFNNNSPRLLYASNTPYNNTLMVKDCIELSTLTKHDKQRIYATNALNLLYL